MDAGGVLRLPAAPVGLRLRPERLDAGHRPESRIDPREPQPTRIPEPKAPRGPGDGPTRIRSASPGDLQHSEIDNRSLEAKVDRYLDAARRRRRRRSGRRRLRTSPPLRRRPIAQRRHGHDPRRPRAEPRPLHPDPQSRDDPPAGPTRPGNDPPPDRAPSLYDSQPRPIIEPPSRPLLRADRHLDRSPRPLRRPGRRVVADVVSASPWWGLGRLGISLSVDPGRILRQKTEDRRQKADSNNSRVRGSRITTIGIGGSNLVRGCGLRSALCLLRSVNSAGSFPDRL